MRTIAQMRNLMSLIRVEMRKLKNPNAELRSAMERLIVKGLQTNSQEVAQEYLSRIFMGFSLLGGDGSKLADKVAFEDMLINKEVVEVFHKKDKRSVNQRLTGSLTQIGMQYGIQHTPKQARQQIGTDIQANIAKLMTSFRVLQGAGKTPMNTKEFGQLYIIMQKLIKDKKLSEDQSVFLGQAIDKINEAVEDLKDNNEKFTFNLQDVLGDYSDILRSTEHTFEAKLKTLEEAQKLAARYFKGGRGGAKELTSIDLSQVTAEEITALAAIVDKFQQRASKFIVNETVEGLEETFKSTILDPDNFSKVLEKHAEKQTVFSSMKEKLKEHASGKAGDIGKELLGTVFRNLGLGGLDQVFNLTEKTTALFGGLKDRVFSKIRDRKARKTGEAKVGNLDDIATKNFVAEADALIPKVKKKEEPVVKETKAVKKETSEVKKEVAKSTKEIKELRKDIAKEARIAHRRTLRSDMKTSSFSGGEKGGDGGGGFWSTLLGAGLGSSGKLMGIMKTLLMVGFKAMPYVAAAGAIAWFFKGQQNWLDSLSPEERAIRQAIIDGKGTPNIKKSDGPGVSPSVIPIASPANYQGRKGDFKWSGKFTPAIEKQVEESAKQHGISVEQARTMFMVESRGNPDAISPTGAMGIGQFTKGTANTMGLKNPMDYKENIEATFRYGKHNQKELAKKGIDTKDDEGFHMYMAHQQGATGWSQILKAYKGEGSISAGVQKNMRLNPPPGIGVTTDAKTFVEGWKSAWQYAYSRANNGKAYATQATVPPVDAASSETIAPKAEPSMLLAQPTGAKGDMWDNILLEDQKKQGMQTDRVYNYQEYQAEMAKQGKPTTIGKTGFTFTPAKNATDVASNTNLAANTNVPSVVVNAPQQIPPTTVEENKSNVISPMSINDPVLAMLHTIYKF